MKISDLTIKTKLMIGFGFLVGMMLIMGIVAIQKSKEFAKVADMRTFIVEKEVDHFKWVGKVKDLFLGNKPSLEIQTDPHKCGLGKWYDSFTTSAEFKNLPATIQNKILEMDAPHKELHATAVEIQHVYHQKHVGLENTLLMRLDDHRRWMQSLMQSLLENKPITVQKDPTQCAFGKWINSEENVELMKEWSEYSALIEKIIPEHNALHQSVDKIEKAVDVT